MSDKKLSDREDVILQAVVHAYVTSADPIGSRAIVKRFNLTISPATVRNVMADLEEAGYLQQKHTSSGRIPTDQGYRYYVNHLMRVQEMTLAERETIERDFATRLSDADAVMRQTSQLLALVSHQTGIVEAPSESLAELRHIEITPIDGRRAVIMVADSYGGVRTTVVPLEMELSGDKAITLTGFLNGRLRGVAIEKLGASLSSGLADLTSEPRHLADLALEVLGPVSASRPGQLFLEGATQLFEHPEFRDLKRAQAVFGLLEERDRVLELLRAGASPDDSRPSRVVIGSEAPTHGTEEISVVSAPYKIGDEAVGRVGILGPRRMPYSRLTGVVEFTAGMLGRLLTRLAAK